MSQVARKVARERQSDSMDAMLEEAGLDDAAVRSLERICLVTCTASAHAAAVGRNWIEHFAGIPAKVELLPMRELGFRPRELVVVLSHAGSTADVRAAMRTARRRGLPLLTIAVDGEVHTPHDGEPRVSATRFMGQLDGLLSLAVSLGCRRDVLTPMDAKRTLGVLRRLGEERPSDHRAGF